MGHPIVGFVARVSGAPNAIIKHWRLTCLAVVHWVTHLGAVTEYAIATLSVIWGVGDSVLDLVAAVNCTWDAVV